MIRLFAEKVIEQLQTEADEMAKANGRGGSDTLEAYREKAGRVKGLEQAIEIVLEIADEFDKDEE